MTTDFVSTDPTFENQVDFSRAEENAEQLFDEEAKKAQSALQQRLVISLLGSVNSGKSKLINAMTGCKYADVKPIAGWTKEVQLFPIPHMPNIMIADTPGLEDVNSDVSARTEKFIEKDADIVLLVVNADVGATRPYRDTLANMKASGRPVVVVLNKMDLATQQDDDTPEEWRRIKLSDTRQRLGLTPDDLMFPVSARTLDGIPQLNAGIATILAENGKDLLFAKLVRDKDAIIDKWIWGATGIAFGLGVIPLPFSDSIPLTALQVGLAIRIANAYGVEATRRDILPFITEIAAGRVGKMLFRAALKLFGWVGGPWGEAIAAGTAGLTAASMTFGLGQAAKIYYQTGMKTSMEDLQEVFRQAAEEFMRENKNKRSVN